MPIKVLLADDCNASRDEILRLLKEEPRTKVVGEARGFGEAVHLTCALRPDVLLLELYMSDECNYPPESIRLQLSSDAKCVLAISTWNDADARALAEKFGARRLLDKNRLCAELIPAIIESCDHLNYLPSPIARPALLIN
jgi:DNA-binding NarL/FixJ family response regulator